MFAIQSMVQQDHFVLNLNDLTNQVTNHVTYTIWLSDTGKYGFGIFSISDRIYFLDREVENCVAVRQTFSHLFEAKKFGEWRIFYFWI